MEEKVRFNKNASLVYLFYSTPQRNTFQLVIASMKTASFAIVLYAKDGIQFTSTPVEDAVAILHAGFSKGIVQGFLFSSQGPYFRITTDEEESIRALAE